MTRLRQAKLLLDFYFAPWGAAKGEVWENISGDRVFNDFNITHWTISLLNGQLVLDDEQIKMMRIVTG